MRHLFVLCTILHIFDAGTATRALEIEHYSSSAARGDAKAIDASSPAGWLLMARNEENFAALAVRALPRAAPAMKWPQSTAAPAVARNTCQGGLRYSSRRAQHAASWQCRSVSAGAYVLVASAQRRISARLLEIEIEALAKRIIKRARASRINQAAWRDIRRNTGDIMNDISGMRSICCRALCA